MKRTLGVLPRRLRGVPPELVLLSFPEEAAAWLGRSVDWVRQRRHQLPGVIGESRETAFFHPLTYITKNQTP